MTDFSKKWANEDRRGRRNEPSNTYYGLYFGVSIGLVIGFVIGFLW